MRSILRMDDLGYLIVGCTLYVFFLKVSTATDTLFPTQVLEGNQTLVSSGQTFELGIFSCGNSINNRYLGIWYKNIPTQTIVWVANGNEPLSDPLGSLKIDDNGNLVLVNRTKNVIWSSSNPSTTMKPVAQLLDTGNLVLKYEGNDNPKSYIWQSFDYPSDTLIEGMKLGWNKNTGMNWYLTSWKSSEDPSPGDFTNKLDPHAYRELVLRNGSIEVFRSGPWNGLRFSGGPRLPNNPVYIPFFVFNDEEVYYTFKRNSNSVISRLVVDPSGMLRRLAWNDRSLEWILLFTVQKDHCDNYGLCGVYGTCNINNAPVCNCLKGFTPKSPKDWDQIDWSGGCIRRAPLNCENGDGFMKLASVKLPDTMGSWVNESMSLKECEVVCLKNCSCTAYANSDIRGEGSGCVLWFGDLFDIREYSNDGQDLYFRLAASELEENGDSSKNTKGVAAKISISVVAGILSLGLIIGCIFWKTRPEQTETGDDENKQDKDYTDENPTEELELPLFDFDTIETATSYFSLNNKLGEGGYGPVYKGKLLTGQEIAVKRLSKDSGQGLNEFKNEVILIAKLQHRNLVRLLGCCIQREEKMLVYEYMPNKSLDSIIFDQERFTLLIWQKRFDIVVGIAQGLLYLHRDSRLRIVHRDLKASNVLLDSEMNPKISDFGMARTFGGNQIEEKTGRVVGTYGYMSPEYAIDGLFSMKSDVFSFGVLVLEIVSGKKNRGFEHPDHDLNLLGHAWRLWNEGKAFELVDTLMEDELPELEVLRCIQLGLLCVQQRPEDRPSMASVVLMLGSEAVILPEPKKPGFYNERSLIEADTLSSGRRFCSNEMTISLLEGR